MQVYLCGYCHLDFVSTDGNRIQGTNLFVSHPENNVTGEMVERVFVRQGIELPAEMAPGDILDIDCSTKGKVLKIAVAKQAK